MVLYKYILSGYDELLPSFLKQYPLLQISY